MKTKIIIAALAISALFMSGNADAQAFDQGTNVINLGIGLGGNYAYYGSGYSQSPALAVSYEKGIWPNIGPGTISLGGLLAYKGISWTNNFQDWNNNNIVTNYTQKESWTYYIIGVRGAYHLKVPNNDKLDPYGGLMLAYYNTSYSYTNTDPNYGHVGYYGYNAVSETYPGYVAMSIFVGARYLFNTNFAVFGELGYGYSTLTIGLSYKW